jgi:hypothetical protein
VPLYNWTGFYIGGNVGAGWNSTGSITDNLTPASTFGTTTNTSFLGGGQVGVNYEFGGGVVVGAEAMFDWLPNTKNTINASNTNAAGVTNTAAANINNRWLTTATGKLGYAWDRVLLYGKGGGAWVGTSNPSIAVNNGAAGAASFATNSSNNFGWTAGLGVGFRGQLVGPSRVGLHPTAEPELHCGEQCDCRSVRQRHDQRQQSQHQHVHRRPELQVRRRLVVTARTYFLPRLGLPQAPGSARGFFYAETSWEPI